MHEIFSRWQSWRAILQDSRQFVFNLRHDARKRGAAIARFVLDAIPLIRIVAGGDQNAAGGLALANEQGNCGSGTRLVGEPDRRSGGADGLGNGGGDSVGSETMIVA